MEFVQPGKTPGEIVELYNRYDSLNVRSILYGTPLAVLTVGSIGIAIKIATGDESLAILYSNKLMAGLHGVGLLASIPPYRKYLSIQDHELNDTAREIAEAEGRLIDDSDRNIQFQNRNRIEEVLHLANRVSPSRMTLFFNRIHFKMEDLLAKVTHNYDTERENAIRQRGDIEGASSRYVIRSFPTSTAEDIARKALEIGLYRWDKVAWDVRQFHLQRRYAHQMVSRIKSKLR